MGAPDASPIYLDVIEAVASVEGTTPDRLAFTLHDHVNTEALELLGRDGRGPWELSFQVPGHDVTVKSDRTVLVDGRKVQTDP